MAINKRLLVKPPSTGITPSEHFGVVLYEGDGSSSHSINGGKFGAGGYFTNAGVVTIPSSVIDTNEHSLSVWFNTGSTGGTQTVFEFNTGNRILFRATSTDANKANFGNGGWFNHGISFSANTWYHLVITFKSGSPAKIYVDGSLQYTTGNISKSSDGSANYLGANNSSGGNNLQGKIDQFRVFQKELSSSEVSTLYAETASTVESLDPLSEDTTDTLQVLGDSSCIATYRFENNEDDLSGNHNGTGSQIQYGAGRYGQAASFNDTSSSKIVIGAQNSVIPNNTTGVSFSFWVYLDSVDTGSNYDHWFVGQENYGGSFEDGEFSVRLYEGKVYTDYAQSGSIYRQRKATTVLSTGQWYHIVATYDTSNANITEVYLNGSLETSSNLTSGGTFTTTALMQNSTNISIGGSDNGYTDGKIDQFRIFTKVLSASEVTTLYNENSLVASYRFEGNANDDTRNYDGTPTNVTYEYGLGFTPDFVWIKNRTTAASHIIHDSTRGAGISKNIYPDFAGYEGEYGNYGFVSSFDTGGFTIDASTNAYHANRNGDDYVAWCLKANGGTTSSNTDGTITSTLQVNTGVGFSIVKYTGNQTTGATVGHGLSAAPEFVIIKQLGTAGHHWKSIATMLGAGNAIYLNLDIAAVSNQFNNTLPTSTVFTLDNDTNVNESGQEHIAYCFHSVDGFSKFGTYTGNGSEQLIETGFEPAFIIIKATSTTSDWRLYDNKRGSTDSSSSYVGNRKPLYANLNIAEGNGINEIRFLSNGFEVGPGNNTNTNGVSFIYMAFAADPDTEQPTVAKSFSTVAYDGNSSSTRSIDGLGFSPSLVWIKNRTVAGWHHLDDVVRGGNNTIFSNATNAATSNIAGGYLSAFEDDGFELTFGTGGSDVNKTGEQYAAWAWKADDNEPTIDGGPAIAVYKFEDNANDVTTNYNGTASNVTYTTGKFNKAAVFNGSSGYIDLGNGASGLSPVLNEKVSQSVSLWMNSNQPGISGNSVIYSVYYGQGISINIYYLADGTLYFFTRYSNNSTAYTTTATFDDGQWHHIAVTIDIPNLERKIYIDNNLETTQTLSSASYGGTGLDKGVALGTNGNFNTQYYEGKLDQVRIYKGVLKAEQVDELYNETASQNDDLTLGAPAETIISANANAGFSIVKYTGNSTAGRKVPHGLSAVPQMIIVKRLESPNDNWAVYNETIGNTKRLALDESGAAASNRLEWNSTTPSATTFTLGNHSAVNTNSSYIAYCFHSVSNYSKIGSYAGTGSAGNAQNIGFQPDFVLGKSYDNPEDWFIVDNVRGGNKYLRPNLSNAESTAGASITFTSTGFQFTGGSFNNSGMNFIYMAFKIN